MRVDGGLDGGVPSRSKSSAVRLLEPRREERSGPLPVRGVAVAALVVGTDGGRLPAVPASDARREAAASDER